MNTFRAAMTPTPGGWRARGAHVAMLAPAPGCGAGGPIAPRAPLVPEPRPAAG